MSDHKQREPFPPRWAFLVLALVIIAGLGFTVYNQMAATADKNTAQANSQTLAQDIQTICATQGKLLVDDRDLCAKAEKVQQNPTEAIPGPKGEPGKDGAPGKDSTVPGPAGKDGAAGKDSTVPGAPGADGADSMLAGPPGRDGADSTVPGPPGANGRDGIDGRDGAAGQPPTSFTFTDKTGTKYTCTPNPPGSSTYTCEAEGVLR